jgi:sugar O-acyltransferase (sialic acid O-acetyltransferase NeuD family)
MNGIIILGAAGLAKEFYYYVKRAKPEIENFIFVNDIDDGQTTIDIDGNIFPVVKDWNFEKKYPFIVAVGNPQIKKILVSKALSVGLVPSETIVDPSAIVLMDRSKLSKGGVISPGCVVTSNITFGDYVTLNLNTTVGHDTTIGDYCTTNPGVHISGQIQIGECNEFGTGCIVRDRLILGSNKTFGAQTAVVKNTWGNLKETFVGIPAKKLEKKIK